MHHLILREPGSFEFEEQLRKRVQESEAYRQAAARRVQERRIIFRHWVVAAFMAVERIESREKDQPKGQNSGKTVHDQLRPVPSPECGILTRHKWGVFNRR